MLTFNGNSVHKHSIWLSEYVPTTRAHTTHRARAQKARQPGHFETHYMSILHTKHVNMLQLHRYTARSVHRAESARTYSLLCRCPLEPVGHCHAWILAQLHFRPVTKTHAQRWVKNITRHCSAAVPSTAQRRSGSGQETQKELYKTFYFSFYCTFL